MLATVLAAPGNGSARGSETTISSGIMTTTPSRFARIGYGFVVSAVMLSQTARAEEGVRADAPVAMADAQLAAFADLVGQPREEVARRLQLDASLVPVAASAAEARMERKRSGKLRAAVGFGLFGAGGLASALLWSSAFSPAGNGYDVDASRAIGAYVAAAGAAVGLGVGISGIVVMARQSQVDNEAVARYRGTARGAALAVPLGPAVRLPLVAIAF